MKTPQESFYGSLDVTDHLLDHNFLEDIAKDRKVIPDPIDDRFFISISNGHENIGFFKSWKFEAIDIFS